MTPQRSNNKVSYAFALNKTQDQIAIPKILICKSTFQRARGILPLGKNLELIACWIYPCSWVHTFGMKYPLDLIYLNKQYRVTDLSLCVRPMRLTKPHWDSHSILEVPSGYPHRIRVGDELTILNYS